MMAGKLDRRITLRAPTSSRTASGQQVETMSDLATVWAQRLPVRAREGFQAAQKFAEAEVHYRIRWRSGLTTRHDIVDQGQVYDIVGILEVGRRVGLDLYARAKVP